MGVGGQRHAPAALPAGYIRYPLYRRLGGPQGRSRKPRKSRPPPGFDPRNRPARTEALYRLSYPDRRVPLISRINDIIQYYVSCLCVRVCENISVLTFKCHC